MYKFATFAKFCVIDTQFLCAILIIRRLNFIGKGGVVLMAVDTEEHLFARTEHGYMLAYDPNSGLTMKQRNLLKMIDGRTRTALYLDNLHNFGNVQVALKELESHGLIVEINAPLKKEKFASSLNSSITSKGLSAFKNINHAPDFQHTILANPQDKEAILRQVISEMSDFVLRNIPENALMVLKELESINSFEELRIALGGYHQLVEKTGEKANWHINSIQIIISNNI